MIRLMLFLTLSTLSLIGSAAPATPPTPAWMSQAVVESLIALQLNDDQKAIFRQALAVCLNDIQANVHKITKRGGFDQARKIKRANKRPWRIFKQTMMSNLTDAQKPLFDAYLLHQKATIAINLNGDTQMHAIGDKQ